MAANESGPRRSGLHEGGIAGAIHRFERAAGLERPGRSPWVWIGPAVNVVGSLAMVMWVGIKYDLGWPTTIPTALVLSFFMGAMSAAFLATWEDEAEEDERRAWEHPAPDEEPPHTPGGTAEVPEAPAPEAPPVEVELPGRHPVGAGRR